MNRRHFLTSIALGAGALLWPLNLKARIKHYLVVGAGIVGTSIAYALQQAGQKVTLIDKDFPAAHASSHTFAWINASYPKQPLNYHLLSRLGLDIYRKWDTYLDLNINWNGSLEWFERDEENQNMFKQIALIQQYGSATEIITKKEALADEPNLIFSQELIARSLRDGVVNPVTAVEKMIQKITNSGNEVIYPAELIKVMTNKDSVTVATSQGSITADRIVYACGIDSNQVAKGNYLKPATPGIIVTSKPFKQTIKKIVVGPGVHIHQRANGVVVMGEQDSLPISHDQRLSTRPEQFPNRQLSLEHGQRIVSLATSFIPQFKDLEIDKVDIGWRPLPRDGKPIVGFLNQYEYLATMHSGISLAPIIAELTREELIFGVNSKLLSDFRPQRFF